MAGSPYRRRFKETGKTCGAYARSTGKPCQCKKRLKGGKCKLHGGMSLNSRDMERITRRTGRVFKKRGPATPEGFARWQAGAIMANRRRGKRRLAALAGLAT